MRTDTAGRPSEARARLLDTATRLFYGEGIHAVGIDRIVNEAQVTRATLYRHFPGKEELVLAYLSEVDKAMRAPAEEARAAGLPPAEAVLAISRSIAEGIRSQGFRGCAFLNAAAEYPDPESPVRKAVIAYRQWFLDTITDLLARIRRDGARTRHVDQFSGERSEGPVEVLNGLHHQDPPRGRIDTDVSENRRRKALASLAAHDDVDAAAA